MAHSNIRSANLGIVAASLVKVSVAGAGTLFVDATVSPGGDGQSWGTAHRHLQDALAAAALPNSGVDEIRIGQGTYRPDESAAHPEGDGSRVATFAMLPGVTLRGGFAGASSRTPDLRNPAAYPTILSGDLPGDDQPNWINHANNSYHVLTATSVGATAAIDGCIVRGGYAAGAPLPAGAGLLIVDASPTISDCTFDQCLASAGGAVSCDNGNPAISDSTFHGNYAWGGRGGALYLGTPSAPWIADCTFSGNTTYGAGGPGDGGAAFLEFSCPATFDHCVFISNSVTTSSLAMYPTGGAISSLADNLTCNGCRFLKNSSPLGAGGAIWSGGDHTTLTSCEFNGNTTKVGGAVNFAFAVGAQIVNSTIVGNTAGDGGGVSLTYSTTATITNSIFWSNTANAPTPYKANIHKDDSSEATVEWTCIQEMWVPEPGEDPLDPANFPGCTDANPLFVDANGPDNAYGTLDDDLRVQSGSPMIDGGRNAAVPAITTTDVAGLSRFFDDPASPDHGDGTAPVVDLGAHEYGPPPVLGDLDGDGDVDPVDLGLLLGAWGTATSAADLNGDGTVGAADLALCLGAWTG